MGITKSICFLLLIFSFFICIFLNFPSASASEPCRKSYCHRTEPIIRFPFRLQNLQPNTCGFPGFDLFCDAYNQTVVNLPNSGRFTVHSIDYAKQHIWVNDPEDCLPRRLLELNLTGSPFNGVFYQDFTLFNCTFDYRSYELDPIACLSGENYTVFASSSERIIRILASTCREVGTVAVPVQWDSFEPVVTTDLSYDIRLTWSWPPCWRCESNGGHCWLSSVNSTVIECRNPDYHPKPRGVRIAVAAGSVLPALLGLFGYVYYLCRWPEHEDRQHDPIMDFPVVAARQPATTTSGLDSPTIKSYPKTTLGESCRLPKPDDCICSICLSEYLPKETLRIMPECQHCFHAECIDKWLQLNASCPICRNSPTSSAVAQDS